MDKLLLRPEEAAQALGVSRATVYLLLARGTLPRVYVGRSMRVPVAALNRWVADRARRARVRGAVAADSATPTRG